ncbi:hypothetical protein U8291_26530 [Pseudomonas sp. A2]|uniref:hypothetical protein n=1 Tax=Pseudomonas sp. A2 TaxID=107445 RepID=UPI002C4DE7D7|nr:hypothetical protein [Pseudomonas sp. A2]MEB3440586.1 hypothetical protein [Pseudomonas sp. A2]
MRYNKKSTKFQPRQNRGLTANNRPSVFGTRDQFSEVYDFLRNTQQSPPSVGIVFTHWDKRDLGSMSYNYSPGQIIDQYFSAELKLPMSQYDCSLSALPYHSAVMRSTSMSSLLAYPSYDDLAVKMVAVSA